MLWLVLLMLCEYVVWCFGLENALWKVVGICELWIMWLLVCLFVCGEICCCYACVDEGDILSLRKGMVMCIRGGGRMEVKGRCCSCVVYVVCDGCYCCCLCWL